jgi:hypothetical protein
MAKAERVPSTPRTTAPEFLIAVNRIRLSQMIRDPVVAAAFKAGGRGRRQRSGITATPRRAQTDPGADRLRLVAAGPKVGGSY